MKKYWGWNDFEDMASDFNMSRDDFEGEVLFASYGRASYEGNAFVLFRCEGKLYEVNGSHCSCWGLEGQWRPEETTFTSLQHILAHGGKFDEYFHGQEAAAALTVLVGSLA